MVIRKHPARGQDAKEIVENMRSAPRLPPSAISKLKSIRLVAGPEVTLINISRGGALIETDALLVPHSAIAIRLVTADAVFLLRGRVLRSRAASFQGSALIYQSALAFDEELPFLDGAQDQPQADTAPEEAILQAGEGEAIDAGMKPGISEQPAMITIDIPIPPWGPDLRQIFGFNDW
jgi:hypothetical protein